MMVELYMLDDVGQAYDLFITFQEDKRFKGVVQVSQADTVTP